MTSGATSLTAAQRAELDVLLAQGVLRAVSADLPRARDFLRHAREALEVVSRIGNNHVCFDAAYNAAHDVGEGLLASYGYRTGSGPGAHAAVGRFLEIVLTDPLGREAATAYDTLRMIRNALRYQAKSPSRAETEVAVAVAQDLLTAARERLS